MRRTGAASDSDDVRLLLVDDNADFLEAARGLLEREGITVADVASTSDEAVERVHELQPDVALLDIDLDGENGFELAHRLASDAAGASTRLILISSHAETDFEELIAASPAVGFLPKPRLSARAIHDMLARAGNHGGADSE
jgi:CheY-like chemotaxis protein